MYPDFSPERKKVEKGEWGVPVMQSRNETFFGPGRDFAPLEIPLC